MIVLKFDNIKEVEYLLDAINFYTYGNIYPTMKQELLKAKEMFQKNEKKSEK